MTSLRALQSGPDADVRLTLEQGRYCLRKECGESGREALAREAWALEQLRGVPGVPRLEQAGPGLLVREFVPGRTLEAVLRDGPPTRPQAQLWLQRLETRLRLLHDRRHWHGDLSPANLLITRHDQVFLLDWGQRGFGTPPFAQPGLSGPEADWHAFQRLREELGVPVPEGAQAPVTRLFGRSRALERLQEASRQAAFCETTIVGVSAPSGGGKTALLHELLWDVPHYGWGQGSTLTSPMTYRLFHSLLESSDLAWGPELLDDPALEQLRATFPALGPAPARCSALAPLQIAQGWKALLRHQAAKAPLLLIFDDVQWMDEASCDLLCGLSHEPIAGLMIVLAWRKEEWSPPPGLRLSFQMDLPAIPAEDVQRWCDQEGCRLPDSQIRQLTAWTHGSPLLISEWLRQPQRPEFSARTALVFRERVRSMPPEVRFVLRRAALAGREFDPALLDGEVTAALRWGEEQQLLLPGPRFSHDKVREALLEDWEESEQRDAHAALAEAYVRQQARPHLPAFHFWQAGERQRAAPLALAAARQERDRAALPSAAYYYDLYCQTELQVPIVLELAEVLRLAGRNDETLSWLERGLQAPEASEHALWLHWKSGQVRRAQGFLVPAFEHCMQALDRLAELPEPEARPMLPEILNLLHEVCHEEVGYPTLARVLLPRLPWVLRNYQSDLVLHANIYIILSPSLPTALARSWRQGLLRLARAQTDPVRRARALSRIYVPNFGRDRGTIHRRVLESGIPVFQSRGETWELAMIYFMLGLYASVQGRLSELGELAARLRELCLASGTESLMGSAVFFEALASGARMPWQRVVDTQLTPRSMWFANWLLAQGVYLLRDGRPAEAYQRVHHPGLRISPNFIDRAIFLGWSATFTRAYAESLPRRWQARRLELYREVLAVTDSALRAHPWARPFQVRAWRERALALAALGRPEEALACLQSSLRLADAMGATYEEALSRQVWGRLGPQHGWPDSEAQREQGERQLEEMGALWELVPTTSGLPAEEVGLAAQEFFQDLSPRARETLERWTGDTLTAPLEAVREAGLRRQQQSQRLSRRLGEETERWQALLRRGPLAVSRFAADGTRLEGSADPNLSSSRVDLDDGEYVLLNLPLARSQFHLCEQLMAAQEADLRRRLAALEELFPGAGPYRAELEKEWAMIVGQGDVPLRETWLGSRLPIREQGEPPWDRVTPAARQALAKIMREALQNIQKHRAPGPIEIRYSLLPRFLQVEVEGRGEILAAAPGEGFGLRAMDLRASLVGGEVEMDEDYRLRIRLPLSPEPIRSAPERREDVP